MVERPRAEEEEGEEERPREEKGMIYVARHAEAPSERPKLSPTRLASDISGTHPNGTR